jgi:hypothetical protein
MLNASQWSNIYSSVISFMHVLPELLDCHVSETAETAALDVALH